MAVHVTRGTVSPGCLLAFFAPFLLAGATGAAVQAVRLLTWRPVPAVVRTSGVERVSGQKGTTYRPLVSYAYRVDGRDHLSERVTVTRESRSHDWAATVAARYPAGARVTAHVSPTDAREAFLDPAPSFLPYLFLLFPGSMCLLFVTVAAGADARRRAAAAPVRASGPRWQLVPDATLDDIAAARRRVLRTWSAIAALSFVPYLLLARVPRDPLAWGAFATAVVIATWLVRRTRAASRVARAVREVAVMIDRDVVRLGDRLEVDVHVATAARAQVTDLEVGIVAESIGRNVTTRHERWVATEARATVALDVPAGELPSAVHAYGPQERAAPDAMHVAWHVAVRGRIDGVAWRVRFPIAVHDPAARAEPATLYHTGPVPILTR